MSKPRFDPDQNPHGELASAAIAVAFALRVRGREDDQAAAALLARLGYRARTQLAGSVRVGEKFEAREPETDPPGSFLPAQVSAGGGGRKFEDLEAETPLPPHARIFSPFNRIG